MSEAVSTGLLDRAIRRITEVWRDMASSVSGEADETLEAQMQACLAGRGGEVSARNRAAKLAQTYLTQDEAGRKEFLRTLARFRFRSRRGRRRLCQGAGGVGRGGAGDREGGAAPGTGAAPAEAADAVHLDPRRTEVPGRSAWVAVESARNRQAADRAGRRPARDCWPRGSTSGFWNCSASTGTARPRCWKSWWTYEAVHAIRSWRDLKNRLDSDRRCYAFFHPRMPGEPLIFVEVALVKGLAGSVQDLLDEKAPVQDPAQADTAIFYSISNCQTGLAGDQLRQFPDQARGRGTVGRIPQPEDVRDPVADSGVPPLAGPAAGERMSRRC